MTLPNAPSHGSPVDSNVFQHVDQGVTPRQGRSIQEVNEARAARRAEIEKRSMALDPPIPASLLAHMDSFQAALQISTPLTEKAWEILKPRLLAQRNIAEAREATITEQLRAVQATASEQNQQDLHSKNTRDLSDSEWELAQAPVRKRLSEHADTLIREKWARGLAVAKSNVAQFAADVLLSVRATYYREMDQMRSDPNGSSDGESANLQQRLTLENMKWLYDNKVKLLGEPLQKELFLCQGCDVPARYYGFEAVIQHYAAKHTSSLSVGNIVVNWRAEWPEDPPFQPYPSLATSRFQSQGLHWSTSSSSAPPVDLGNVEYATLKEENPATEVAAYPVNNYSSRQFTYDLPPFSSPDLSRPQSSYSAYMNPSGYPGETQFHPGLTSVHPGNQTTGTHHIMHGGPPSGSAGFVPALSYMTSSQPLDKANSLANSSFSPPFSATDLYHTQMNEMAKHARDVWFGTSGIKDIPPSVRIYVVIQHVAFRFEQRYTNEPSLAMFLDGLDHNPLMRPVRSLNGLACKTCVSAGFSHTEEDQSHSTQATADRKLYTLPHLLNHFRAAHVETSRPTIDLQTGMEALNLDWKRDMIELPHESLVANLVNAPGMDDKKFQLIAWVFPNVFSNPLPKAGSLKGSIQPVRNSQRRDLADSGPKSQGSGSFNDVLPPASPNAASQPRASPKYREPYDTNVEEFEPTVESPGDDEYDPHRPAYLGQIIESHQVIRPFHQDRSRASDQGEVQVVTSTQLDAAQRLDDYSKGAYGDQLLRHRNRSSRRLLDQERHRLQNVTDRTASRSPRTVALDLISPEAHRDYASLAANVAAADKFLNELTPSIRSNGDGPEVFMQEHRTDTGLSKNEASTNDNSFGNAQQSVTDQFRNSPLGVDLQVRPINRYSMTSEPYKRSFAEEHSLHVQGSPRNILTRTPSTQQWSPRLSPRSHQRLNDNSSEKMQYSQRDNRVAYLRNGVSVPQSTTQDSPTTIWYESSKRQEHPEFEQPHRSLWQSERSVGTFRPQRQFIDAEISSKERPVLERMPERHVEFVPNEYVNYRSEGRPVEILSREYVLEYPREHKEYIRLEPELEGDHLRSRESRYYYIDALDRAVGEKKGA